MTILALTLAHQAICRVWPYRIARAVGVCSIGRGIFYCLVNKQVTVCQIHPVPSVTIIPIEPMHLNLIIRHFIVGILHEKRFHGVEFLKCQQRGGVFLL